MKMYLKRKRNITKHILFLIILIIICFIYLSSKNINTFFIEYAEKEVYKITKDIINSSKQSISSEKIYSIDDRELSSIINYNDKELIFYSNKVKEDINKKYKILEKDNHIVNIPLFSIFKNSIISGLGPNIPVKIKLLGNVNSDISFEVKEYGINSSLVIIKNKVTITERIVLPFIFKDIVVEGDYPISYKIINGKIPEYYSN